MNVIKRVRGWYRNGSLSLKISVLVLVVGVLPLGITFMVSMAELRSTAQEQQQYAVNQGYTQVFQAVEDSLSRAYNISTLLAVDDIVRENIIIADQSHNLAEQLECFDRISTHINGMEMVFDPNSIVFFVDSDFVVAGSQTGRFRSLDVAQELDWYAQMKANQGRPTWITFQDELAGKQYIGVAREIWSQQNYQSVIGTLAVIFEQQELEELLVASVAEQTVYLETAAGDLLAANVPEAELTRLPLGQRGRNDGRFERCSISGTDYLVRSRMMGKTNLYMVSIVSAGALEQKVSDVSIRLSFFYVIISLAGLLAVIPLARSITKRIFLLKSQITQMQDGIVGRLDVEESCSDEIGQLIVHYNNMVDKMGDLLQEQYYLGQSKIEAELRALQSQINPHFLYNTLDMINWMAQRDETGNICDVVQAMSKFYRLTLSKGHDVVSIGDEIKMCAAYMEIQKRRYRGRIIYEVEIDEEIERYMIPKITLQPFLENAIVHGINEKEDARGVVMLNGWMEDGRITLSVTDDGTGMVEADKDKPRSGSHYGMSNIARRLELYFGENIPIQIESSPGIGTCIVINIPARTDKGAEEAAT